MLESLLREGCCISCVYIIHTAASCVSQPSAKLNRAQRADRDRENFERHRQNLKFRTFRTLTFSYPGVLYPQESLTVDPNP